MSRKLPFVLALAAALALPTFAFARGFGHGGIGHGFAPGFGHGGFAFGHGGFAFGHRGFGRGGYWGGYNVYNPESYMDYGDWAWDWGYPYAYDYSYAGCWRQQWVDQGGRWVWGWVRVC